MGLLDTVRPNLYPDRSREVTSRLRDRHSGHPDHGIAGVHGDSECCHRIIRNRHGRATRADSAAGWHRFRVEGCRGRLGVTVNTYSR